MQGGYILLKYVKTFLATAILGMTASAYAVESVPFGTYVEVNLGTSSTNDLKLPATTSMTSSGTGYNLIVGYKIMPFFAAEAGWTRFATANIKNSAGVVVAKDSHYSYQLAARAILPIEDSGFELFAKLGITRLVTNLTVNDNAGSLAFNNGPHNAAGVYMGVGASYAFTPSAEGNIQWSRAKGSNLSGSLDLYSIGVTVFM